MPSLRRWTGKFSQMSIMSSFKSDASASFDSLPWKTRTAVYISLALVATWFLAATMLLIAGPLRYSGVTVDLTRRMVVTAVAEQVSDEVAGVFLGAITVRNAFHYAVQRRLYFDPFDYDSVKMTAEPVFAAEPAVLSVDLAFTDRNSSISVRRMPERIGGGHPGARLGAVVYLQTDAAGCSSLGPLGCLVSSLPAPNQSWYPMGLSLAGGSENPGQQSGASAAWLADGFASNKRTMTYRPRLPGLNAYDRIAWSPAYSLIFRSVFPGSTGDLSLVGRVTIELGALSNLNAFRATDRLGPKSKIYICDNRGSLLGMPDVGQLAFVESPSGHIRFRKIWELSEPWAKDLVRHRLVGGLEYHTTIGEFHLHMIPIRAYSLEHFMVLVVAERDLFAEAQMISLGTAGYVVASLPTIVAILLVLCVLALKYWQEYQLERKVHLYEKRSGDDLVIQDGVSHSDGMAFIRNAQS